MSPIKIGTTTREVSEVAAFEFHLPLPGGEGTDATFPSLRAQFKDGTVITTRGNEAVTLKVLLASIGVPEINASPAKEAFAPQQENHPSASVPAAVRSPSQVRI